MRRILGAIVLGVGAFALVLAPLLRFWVYPSLARWPLEKVSPSISEGTDFVKYDPAASAAVPLGAPVRATRIVVPDVKASTKDVIVVDESLCLMVVKGDTPQCAKDDPRLLSVTTDRVAADRRTGLAVNEPRFGENVNGDTSVRHSGLAYKFGFDVAKRTYPFFDTTLGKAFPMRYAGEETVQGLRTYKFVQQVPPGPVEIIPNVRGSYANTRTVWVDPKTGLIIKGQEQPKQVFTDGDLAGKTALQGTITFTDATIKDNISTAKKGISQLRLIGGGAQLVLLVLGLLLVAAGLVLLLTGPRDAGASGDRSEVRTPVEV